LLSDDSNLAARDRAEFPRAL